jgi:hypothetical protein
MIVLFWNNITGYYSEERYGAIIDPIYFYDGAGNFSSEDVDWRAYAFASNRMSAYRIFNSGSCDPQDDVRRVITIDK